MCTLTLACSQPKKETAEEASIPAINEMPLLQVTLLSGENVRLDTLPGKMVLIFFGPDCDHCQREATDFREHLDSFKNYKVYFIASRDFEEIDKFSKTYGLSGQPNVAFARASIPDVVRVMGAIGTPTLYIYSANRRLVKKFPNETKMEEIIKFL
ncbi:hypothetical protein BH10BAC4_BH10BAC4_10700 [soil metagenome]